MFIISLRALELSRCQPSAILSTSLTITLRYHLPCCSWTAPTPTGRHSWPCAYDPPASWLLLPSFLPSLLSPRLCLRPQAWKLSAPPTFLLPIYRHLYYPIVDNLEGGGFTQQKQVYMRICSSWRNQILGFRI